jgi:hypothetical protein
MDKNELEVKKAFHKYGWVVVQNSKISNVVKNARKIFLNNFKSRFRENASVNRELIKRFGDHPSVSSIYSNPDFVSTIKKISSVSSPVFCGSLVTHYTSNDITGGGYGLPFHQDYPSMGSSLNSIICWSNLTDASRESHGVEVLSSNHMRGLLQGQQTDRGYIISEDEYNNSTKDIPTVAAGSVLIMSAFLPHKTYVNPNYDGWKLSLSRRFDDLNEKTWAQRGYKNAYGVSVDRGLYLGASFTSYNAMYDKS